MDDPNAPKITIDYVYRWSDDLEEMRRFYTELIGLQEISNSVEEEHGYVAYKCVGFTLYILRGKEVRPEMSGWTKQIGREGGTIERTSYTIRVPESAFRDTVTRLRKAGVQSLHEMPKWFHNEYWSYIVQDPMGATIEVYMKPSEKPEEKEWMD